MNDNLRYYTTLGLPPGAPLAEVRAQFRILAKHHHPDLHGGDAYHQEQFLRIHAAYEFLADPRRKALYDAPLSVSHTISGLETGGGLVPLWVRVGEASLIPPVTDDERRANKTRHRRLSRVARGRLAAAFTWTLTVTALLLYGVVLRTAHTRTDLVRLQDTASPPGVAALTTGSMSDALVTPPLSSGAPLTDAGHVWSPVTQQSLGTLEPAGGPNTTNSFSNPVAPAPDPTSTALVPARTVVDDGDAPIDPRYTSIDSRYTSP